MLAGWIIFTFVPVGIVIGLLIQLWLTRRRSQSDDVGCVALEEWPGLTVGDLDFQRTDSFWYRAAGNYQLTLYFWDFWEGGEPYWTCQLYRDQKLVHGSKRCTAVSPYVER